MIIYECCFRDRMGHVAWRTNLTAADDAGARDSADRMLATILDYDLIELWRGAELIHTARRMEELN